jgi:hypothetical protein
MNFHPATSGIGVEPAALPNSFSYQPDAVRRVFHRNARDCVLNLHQWQSCSRVGRPQVTKTNESSYLTHQPARSSSVSSNFSICQSTAVTRQAISQIRRGKSV